MSSSRKPSRAGGPGESAVTERGQHKDKEKIDEKEYKQEVKQNKRKRRRRGMSMKGSSIRRKK
jgi:hypothetical protein